MPCIQVGTRKRVIILHRLGYSIRDIQRRLNEEAFIVFVQSLKQRTPNLGSDY